MRSRARTFRTLVEALTESALTESAPMKTKKAA
ncbi:Uncharacterised protein [Vibrio cholerae]|nr:Uncharacterised protein [Vibrio cholerae]